MIITALVVLGTVCLAVLGVCVYLIRKLEAVSGLSHSSLHTLANDAFDRLQSRSITEIVEAERMRAENSVAVKNLQDELARTDPRYNDPKASSRKVHDVNGREYDPNDLEVM
jgi:hypothetical protein